MTPETLLSNKASHSKLSLGGAGGARGTGAASGSPPEAEGQGAGLAEAWLLDSRQVARLLGVGRTKVFEMMARRELPVIQIGRCVRVPRHALQQWIEERTTSAEGFEALRLGNPTQHRLGLS